MQQYDYRELQGLIRSKFGNQENLCKGDWDLSDKLDRATF